MAFIMRTVRSQRWLFVWLFPALLALTLTAAAQEGGQDRPAPIILTEGQEKYPLGRHLELLQSGGHYAELWQAQQKQRDEKDHSY